MDHFVSSISRLFHIFVFSYLFPIQTSTYRQRHQQLCLLPKLLTCPSLILFNLFIYPNLLRRLAYSNRRHHIITIFISFTDLDVYHRPTQPNLLGTLASLYKLFSSLEFLGSHL